MKFLHLADLHPKSMATVGGKLVIDPVTGLSIGFTDFINSMDFVFKTLEEKQIKLLLIAGDVFDIAKPSMDELKVVMSFLERCLDYGIQVIVIAGNHDVSQHSHQASALAPLVFLNVHIVEQPKSILLDVGGKKVRIDCLPYPSRGRLAANMQDRKTCTPEELTAFINRGLYNILANFQLVPEDADHRILLAHGSVEQAVVGEQPRTLAHDVFLPIMDVAGKYDYVALGHIHQTQAIADRGMYCGSLLRQGFGEEKEKKGFLVCEITPGGVITTHISNPHARIYKTLTVQEVAEFYPEAADLQVVYRVKDTIPEDAIPHVMPTIQRFTQALPFVQVDVEIQKEDRMRDSQLSNQMNSNEALDRCLERDGITEPALSLCRQLHLELCEGVGR